MITNWVWKDNIWVVLSEIAQLISYDFDDSDQIAIEFGFKDTDSEDDRWFTYEFQGTGVLKFQVADEIGTDTCILKIESPKDFEQLIEYILRLAQSYKINSRK